MNDLLQKPGTKRKSDQIFLTGEPSNKIIKQGGDGDDENIQNIFKISRIPGENYFTLEIHNSKSFLKPKNSVATAQELTYKAHLKYPSSDIYLSDLTPQLTALFQTLLDELVLIYGRNGIARIYIDHPNLEKAIIVVPTPIHKLSVPVILDHIDNVVNSAGDIPADDTLDINVAVIRTIQGSGRKKILHTDDFKAKKSIVTISNKDNTCLARAVVVAHAHMEKFKFPADKSFSLKYDRLRNSKNKTQGAMAQNLIDLIKIDKEEMGNLQHIPKYEDFLKVGICVISASLGNKRVYNGNAIYTDRLFLLHSGSLENGHFDVITKVNAMMNTQYYCEECGKGFKDRTSHKCRIWCNVCGRKSCTLTNPITCSVCNRLCRSENCMKAHLSKITSGRGKFAGIVLKSLCERSWECPECKAIVDLESRGVSSHECGEVFCNICKQYFLNEHHLCYMKSLSPKTDFDKFIFYDFECRQDNENGVHTPNFVVAHTACSNCKDENVDEFTKCENCGTRCSKCNKYNRKSREYEFTPCDSCGFRQVIFSGDNTKESFCKWLISEDHSNFTAIAHNSRAYDSYFIYSYLMDQSICPDPIIFAGTKIMYMYVQRINLRLLDSLNFLPMPLDKLPKSFGLKELKKGFFPHLFNTKENQNVILSTLPDKKYYNPESMSKDKREEFLTWYEKNKNCNFDFKKEIKEYCVSDVDILLRACCEFRELMLKATGDEEKIEDIHNMIFKTVYTNAVDPFSFLTIASVCIGIFRTKFLPEDWLVLTEENSEKNPNCLHDFNCECEWLKGIRKNGFSDIEVFNNFKWTPENKFKIVRKKFVGSKIGIIPAHGYSGDIHSKESIEWLHVLQEEWAKKGKNISIQSARSTEGEKIINFKGQKKVIRYKVDGYFEYDGEKYVCEYYGCNWHGCTTCFPFNRENTFKEHKSLGQRWRDTILKENRLKEMGYRIINMWSCDFHTKVVQDVSLNEFVKSLNIQEPIDVRDCYFGGRTNALTLHKTFSGDEKCGYVDFTSLYPSVLKYDRYPVGHPVRITKDFESYMTEVCNGECDYTPCTGMHVILPYFGMMKVQILPPNDISHPVLPIRCADKLKFPLCFKCATSSNKKICTCSDAERAFIHTYCTPELETAINMGYEVLKIFEVLHWPTTEKYNTETKSGGIFTNYINTFLKIKQQASGYPPNVISDSDKDLYIDNYFKHEGILLAKDKIVKNPGLRSLSKLALNSFYGKFGQRTNMKRSKFVDNVGELYSTITDRSINLVDFHIMNDDIMQLEFSNSEDFKVLCPTTNVIIAAFCTCWARLKLWNVMNKLGNRVLYHDTDSIIYSYSPEDIYKPPIGEYLGDLTSELECKEVGCSGCDVGHWITEFVSCGPKNYSYRINSGQVVCKVRGFSLNHRNSQVVNFESMKDSLFAWKEDKPMNQLLTVKTEILRSKFRNPVVYSRIVSKHYGVVYDKRVVMNDYTSKPFGYRM